MTQHAQVGEYNKLVQPKHRITGVADEAVAFVLGSGGSFWEPFVAWVSEPWPKDPADEYTKHTVERVLAESFPAEHTEARYDWYFPPHPKFVHVQTAAHLAGVAHYDQQVMWLVHPVFGLWCVIRAVVIFPEVRWSGPQPAAVPSLLTDAERTEIARLSQVASGESWQNPATMLMIRDAVARGREHRYTGDQLDYFYPITHTKRQVLARAKARQARTGLHFPAWQPAGADAGFAGARSDFQSVRVGQHLLVLGGRGRSATALSDVQSAEIGADGATLGPWKAVAPLPAARAGFACAVVDSSVLVMGGEDAEGRACDEVWRGTVSGDGSVAAWEAAGRLPCALARPCWAVYAARLRTFVLLVGGRDGSGRTSDEAWSCAVDRLSGAPEGPWQTCGSRLRGGRSGAACLVEGGTLVVAGGVGDDGEALGDVQSAVVRQDGLLDAWQLAPHALPAAVHGHVLLARRGRALALGGCGGRWAWNRFQLPSPRWGHQAVATEAGVFLLGGQDAQGPLCSVHFARFHE